ncbi:hypothetical protein [Sphingobium sp.]|uniref:hypothetical protein n=1 Tax=Sphingobium sp. TaxID=1912891 RepID=UPI00262C9972|nr:hypothetical protein [Sphingobium sp.]
MIRRPFTPHVCIGIAKDGGFKVTTRPADTIPGNPTGHYGSYDEARAFAQQLASRYHLPLRHRDGLSLASGTRGE